MIAIKDMKAPETCMSCRFARFSDYHNKWACYACLPIKFIPKKWYYADKRRVKYCPLIEVEVK